MSEQRVKKSAGHSVVCGCISARNILRYVVAHFSNPILVVQGYQHTLYMPHHSLFLKVRTIEAIVHRFER